MDLVRQSSFRQVRQLLAFLLLLAGVLALLTTSTAGYMVGAGLIMLAISIERKKAWRCGACRNWYRE